MQVFLAEIESRAFRMAQLATGNRDDALDIVQDAMMKLVQKYSGHDKTTWKPLFYSILESRILDWHRRQQVRNRFRSWLHLNDDEDESEDVLEQQPAENNSIPDFQLQDAQFMQSLNEALSELPVRQQQVFLLLIWEGLDISQTAKVMQCSESSVKTHYARALEKLREALKEHQS
ncbi:MAG TPA: RNA polymerase sigma factor [Methylophilaceae bacterium]|nr:RNA polymerase sigma factor [Methylophilaceae bacterium]HAJ71501.1 RNA polymerase sigma factor [Methylophilaceae bacterium]